MVSEWLEWRSKGIGASDVAGILGISPWASRYSIWLSKTYDPGAGEFAAREAMQWGKLLEDAIIAEAARRLGVTAHGAQTRVEHSAYPWARCTVDSYCTDEHEREGVIEAKNTGENYWQDLPDYYEAQVLWQLEVTGLSYGWVAALHNGRKLSLWRVDANPGLQRDLLETARYFWERHVLTGNPPALDGSEATTTALAQRYVRSDPGETVELDAYADTLDAIERADAEAKVKTREADRLRNLIKDAMGRAEAGTIGGEIAATWKSYRTRRMNLEKMRAEHPQESAECEEILESRRFVVKRTRRSGEIELAS